MRVVSTVVGYILVLMVSIAVDVALLSIYASYFSRATLTASALASVAAEGLVHGAYSVAPCTVSPMQGPGQGGVPAYIETACVYVSILNPNPVPVEVMLLAHIPGASYNYKVVDLLSPLFGGILWDTPDARPPPGVSITDAGWFSGPASPPGGFHRALRMEPGRFASFRVPLYQSGTPSEVLACTRVGCTRLHTVSVQLLVRSSGVGWLIDPRGERTVEENRTIAFPVTQYWDWEAKTLAGPKGLCTMIVENLIINPWIRSLLLPQTLRKGGAVCCSDPCPSDCKYCTVVWTAEKGFCDEAKGVMTPTTLLVGYPPNVLLAYVTDDPSFSFVVERKQVRAGPGYYTLYGFDSSSYPQLVQSYWYAIGEWKNYDGWTCKERHIVVRASYFADPNRSSPLSSIHPHVRKLYVYAATKGPVRNSFIEMHSVELVVRAVKKNEGEVNITVLRAEGDSFVDNDKPGGLPYVNTDEVVEIVVEAKYVMRLKPLLIGCFATVLDRPLYCGSNIGDLRARLAFYVEIIPDRFITKDPVIPTR